jgi:hypothetical protein
MLGGMLAGANYYTGSDPVSMKTSETNPKGVFEDREINAINEALLAPHFPRRVRTSLARRLQDRWVLPPRLRWAASLPLGIAIEAPPELSRRIDTQVARTPFCFKDPRFCYTLPAWRPHVGDALFVCVFREPGRTANSIVTEWRRHPERRYEMSYERALGAWRAMYRQVLSVHRKEGEWLFLHYDDVLSSRAIPALEDALGVSVDANFPDRSLQRSNGDGGSGPEDTALYEELCRLAAATVAHGSARV